MDNNMILVNETELWVRCFFIIVMRRLVRIAIRIMGSLHALLLGCGDILDGDIFDGLSVCFAFGYRL